MFPDRLTDGFVNVEALLSPHLWYNTCKIGMLFLFVMCFIMYLHYICIVHVFFLRPIDGWFCQSWGTVLHSRCVEKFLCCLVLSLYLCCNSNCICVLILLYLCNYIYCTFIILLLYLYFISAFSRMEKWNSFSYS